MLQIDIEPRKNWQEKLLEFGFDFYEVSANHPYWCESRYFQLNRGQVDKIDAVTEELHRMAIEAVDHVFKNNLLHLFGLPEKHNELLKHSFETDKTFLYGRFDFVWDGSAEPKMLEYNAQTPTSLFEAAVAAWDWMREGVDSGKLPPNSDQFNLLDERLITQFSYLAKTKDPESMVLHFVCDDSSSEDRRTITYLAECSKDAGFEPVILDTNEIQLTEDNKFADHNSKRIHNIFMLYPYEFALLDEYGDHILESGTRFIEPIWKVLLSSKALLPIMWELNPGHPNLLETYFSNEPLAEQVKNKVVKPIYSREGANINIILDGEKVEGTDGNYGSEGYITQEFAKLVEFETGRCVVGSWMIGNTACGISFRESDKLITNDVARFIPHIFFE